MSDLGKLKDTLLWDLVQDGATPHTLQLLSESIEGTLCMGLAIKIDDERFRISQAVGNAEEHLQGLNFVIGEGFLGHTVATGQSGYWTSISHDPRVDFFARNGILPKSVFCYPIMQKHDVIGILFSTFSIEVKPHTLTLLETLFFTFGRQVLADRLEENLQAKTMRISAINELIRVIMTVPNMKNILYILLDMSLNMIQGPFTCIAFKPPEEDSAVELLSRGIARPKASQYGRELANDYFGRKASDFSNHVVPVVRKFEQTKVIECPMFFHDEVVAVLAVASLNEKKIEELSQLVYTLSFIGGFALQRSYSAAHVNSWKRDIELIHRTSAFWNKAAYDYAMELQQLSVAFAKRLSISNESICLIECTALLTLFELAFVSELLPNLPDDLIQILDVYHVLCTTSRDLPSHISPNSQILALAQFHLRNTEINFDGIQPDLRKQFELFIMQKDVESQEIYLFNSKQSEYADTDVVSLPEAPPLEQLTSREQEVLKLLVKGNGNRDIAQTLFISEHTVKNHLTNIFQKLGVSDRTQAIAFVYRYMQ